MYVCVNCDEMISTHLYNAWRNAGTGRYHASDTSFVYDKVANCKKENNRRMSE